MSPAAATATAMTRDQNGYVRRETLVAVAINAALSAIFCFIVFGGSAAIAIADLVADAVPQSFMIALMTTIVPTLITRRRLRAGTIAPLALAESRLPSNLALRALLVAMLAAAAGLASHWLLLAAFGPVEWPFGTVLTLKIAYGAALAAICAPWLLRRALAD